MKPTDTCARVLLDGVLVAAQDARVSPLGDGFMFGHGLFETIKVLQGRPVFFTRHAARLERSADEMGLNVTAGLPARIEQLLAANALTAGAVKVVIFQGESGPAELILARTSVYPAKAYETGFSVKTFPDVRRGDGLGRLKTLNYFKNSQARKTARAAGFDEALFVDPAGAALEGAATNLFVVKDGRVWTPAASHGILPGIARGVVLSLSEGNPAEGAVISSSMLHEADEIFVTNALLGVMPVARVDDRVYWLRGKESVTGKILDAYRKAELRSIAQETPDK